MTRVAAVDCGTNSIRLLIAEVDPASGTLTDLDRRMEIVRLGQDVDRTGRIAQPALARTLEATRRYAQACEQHGVQRIRFVATSATRDAQNRADFVDGVRAALGVAPEVVTGVEEAQLSFAGATRELFSDGVEGPYLVVDIGGGSTEFVLGTERVEATRSVDIGCVRLTERHLHSDPPTADETASARRDVDAAVAQAAQIVPLGRARVLVGLAGSVTTVAADALGLTRYDSARIHRSVLPVAKVRASCDRLLAMTRAERAALPYMHPGRVDVIGAGALVWREVVSRLARDAGIREVVASEHDILDGIAFSIA